MYGPVHPDGFDVAASSATCCLDSRVVCPLSFHVATHPYSDEPRWKTVFNAAADVFKMPKTLRVLMVEAIPDPQG